MKTKLVLACIYYRYSFTASLSQGGFDKWSVFITGPGTAACIHMNRAAKSPVICAPVWPRFVCVRQLLYP